MDRAGDKRGASRRDGKDDDMSEVLADEMFDIEEDARRSAGVVRRENLRPERATGCGSDRARIYRR